MKFKYHKSYKGFYLLEDNKFKRPYQKLNEEKTLENLANKVEFKQDEVIEIEDKYVALLQKEKTNEVPQKISPLVKEKKVSRIDFNKLELNYKIPRILLENLYNVISKDQSFSEEELLSILASIENIILLDGLFFSKVQKIFYYNAEELNFLLYNLGRIIINFKIKNKFFDDIIIKILDFFKRVCYNLIRKFIFFDVRWSKNDRAGRKKSKQINFQ